MPMSLEKFFQKCDSHFNVDGVDRLELILEKHTGTYVFDLVLGFLIKRQLLRKDVGLILGSINYLTY